MSLYGNVKKVGSANFQFDRKYSSRVDMEANKSTDNVHAGRYVLIEYGYRFGKDEQNIVNIENGQGMTGGTTVEEVYLLIPKGSSYDSSVTYYVLDAETHEYITLGQEDIDNWTDYIASHSVYKKVPKITFQIINTEDGGIRLDKIIENDAFKTNAEKDLLAFGAVYDSTVWQKIYVQGTDKYVMVAELNAMAPKLEVTQDPPIIYETVTDGDSGENVTVEDYRTKGIITGKFDNDGKLTETVRLTNALETYNKSHFDTAVDTELTYLLHQPSVLNVELSNNSINYNENGFNMVYGYPEDEGISGIVWIPKNYDKNGEVTYLNQYILDVDNENITDNNGNHFAKLMDGEYPMNTKMLYMNFPALGNIMNALYNLLYGKPDPTDDLEHGAMRPYFKRFIGNLTVENRVTTLYDGETEYIVNNTLSGGVEYITIAGKIGDEVTALLNPTDAIRYTNLSPESVSVVFKPQNSSNLYDINSTEYASLEKNENGFPTISGNFYLYDAEGIVTRTIHIPNGDEDPNLEWLSNIPGLSDILANSDAGLATVLSSLFGDVDPLTGTTKFYLYNDWQASTEDGSSGPAITNKPKVIGGYKETYISVPGETDDDSPMTPAWAETPGYFWNINPETIAEQGKKISYPHTETVTSSLFSGGHYGIDFNTWQVKSSTIPDISILVKAYDPSSNPHEAAIAGLIYNQEHITITLNNDKILITSDTRLLQYSSTDGTAAWVALDIDVGFTNITKITINDYTYTEADLTSFHEAGLEAGHIIYMINSEANMPITLTVQADGFEDSIYTINYHVV